MEIFDERIYDFQFKLDKEKLFEISKIYKNKL